MQQAAEKIKKHPVEIELEKYKNEGANLLIPTTDMTGLSDMHKPVVDKVYLSPDPKDGDVYSQSDNDKNLLITGTALAKLAICAGVVWSPHDTLRTDGYRDRNYISFQAVGGIRKIDGQIVSMVGHDDIDFIDLEEDLIEAYTKKAPFYYKDKKKITRTPEEQKDYIDFCVNRDLRFKRKHKMALVESGAKNRVLRKLLCLKSSYTREELLKPFVVVRVSFQPDFNDPAIRQQFISASIQGITGIYGGAPAQLPAPSDIDNEPINVTPATDSAEPPESKPEEQGANPLDEYINADLKSQITILENLVKQKGYDLKPKLKKDQEGVKDLPEKRRSELFKALIQLPDDDIPF